MKKTFAFIVGMGLLSCDRPDPEVAALKRRVDSLQSALAQAYVPGFGELMSGIQVHHAKLWFAGENRNWKLADFEIHEIMEAMETIRKFQAGRAESKHIGMIDPLLDSMSAAIRKSDPEAFRGAYSRLTEGCNECHRLSEFGFNRVKIPDTPPFTNQVFQAGNP